MPHEIIMSQRVTYLIKWSLTLVGNTIHANPVKVKIMDGNPDHFSRRGLSHRIPCETITHIYCYDK
jgi:hypothetical protein